MDRLEVGVLDSLFPPKWKDKIKPVQVEPASTIADLAPQRDPGWGAILNGKMIRESEWDGTVVPNNSFIIFTPLPANFVAPLATLLLQSAAYMFAASAVNLGLGKLFGLYETDSFEGDTTTTYTFQNLRQTAESGLPIKVVYGTHPVAGNLLELDLRRVADYGSRLDMTLGLCEGEIASINSVSVNGNDISLDTESADFGTIATPSYNLGTNTQSALGSDGTSTTHSVGLDMSYSFNDGTGGQTVTYTTTGDVDRFRLNILFPSGLYSTDGSNRRADFVYSYRNLEWTGPRGPFYSRVETNKVGAFIHSIDVTAETIGSEPVRGTYEITLRQTFYNGSLGTNELTFAPTLAGPLGSKLDTVTEIQNQVHAYPNIATLRLTIDASAALSGSNVPNVIATVTGRKIQKWDGVDLANPSFVDADADSPAWIVYDLLTNTRYGLGAWVNADYIDLTSFQSWANWCEELVDDGQGTSEKRAVFDGVFDGNTNAWEAIQRVCASARAILYTIGETIKVKYEHDRSVSQMFTMGNIAEGSWQQGYVSRLERPTRFEIQFLNKDNGYQPDVVGVEDPDSVDLPFRVTKVDLPGVVRESQALREARFRLNLEKLGETVGFECDIDACAVEPGDLIRVSHDVPQWGTSGRVISATSTSVTLDQDAELESGVTYSITVRHPDDTRTTTDITSAAGSYPAGTALTVASWTTQPAKHDLYALGPFTITGKDIVVTNIRTTGDLKRAIEGVVYNAEIHNDAVAAGTSGFKSAIAFDEVPGNVTHLTAKELDVEGSGVYLSWEYPEGLMQSAQIYRKAGNYTPVATVAWPISQVEIPEIAGDEELTYAVVAVSPSGDAQSPANAAQVSIRPGAQGVMPAAVTGIVLAQDDDLLRISWSGPTNTEVSRYEVRRGLNWVGSTSVGLTSDPHIETAQWCPTLTSGLTESYWVRPVSINGKYGRIAKVDESNELSVWTSGSIRSDDFRDSSWAGAGLTNLSVNSDDDLELTTAGSQAKFQSPTYDIGTNGKYRIGAVLHTEISDDAWSSDYSWRSKTGIARTWHGYTDPTKWNTVVQVDYRTRPATTGSFTDWRPLTTRITETSFREIQIQMTLTPSNNDQVIKIKQAYLLMEIV